jgi:hypothetical protein
VSGWIWIVPRSLTGGVLIALCAAFTLACKTPYEQAYGRSFEEHNALTIANPSAGADDPDAPHPDGASTDTAIYKMRTREAETHEPEPASVVNVDIGS